MLTPAMKTFWNPLFCRIKYRTTKNIVVFRIYIPSISTYFYRFV